MKAMSTSLRGSSGGLWGSSMGAARPAGPALPSMMHRATSQHGRVAAKPHQARVAQCRSKGPPIGELQGTPSLARLRENGTHGNSAAALSHWPLQHAPPSRAAPLPSSAVPAAPASPSPSPVTPPSSCAPLAVPASMNLSTHVTFCSTLPITGPWTSPLGGEGKQLRSMAQATTQGRAHGWQH